jgi:hypothetical protein
MRPPPPKVSLAYLTVRIPKSAASAADVRASLCRLLASGLRPFAAASGCDVVFESSVALYYGMYYDADDLLGLRDLLQKTASLSALTATARLPCDGTTIALGIVKAAGGPQTVVYRCAPSPLTCVP